MSGAHRRFPIEYRTWAQMKDRCLNPKCRCYARYGGRGITVFPEWVASFDAFYSSVGARPSALHSLDRIDNTRGYWPGNVKWATSKEQANNRRDNYWITYRGERFTVAQLAVKLGLPETTVRRRAAQGWDDQSLAMPPLRQKKFPIVTKVDRSKNMRTIHGEIDRDAFDDLEGAA